VPLPGSPDPPVLPPALPEPGAEEPPDPLAPAGLLLEDATRPLVPKVKFSLSLPRPVMTLERESSLRGSVAGATGTLTVAVVTRGTSGNSTRATGASFGSASGCAAAGFAAALLAVRTTGTGGFSCGINGRCAVSVTGAAFIRARSTACRIGQSARREAVAFATNGSAIGMSIG
jgi:hypothetical protein